YRGAAPINWAIVNGETETGVSIITLAERMDAGDVLRIGRIPIRQWDTAELVYNKLAELSPCTLLDAIDDIEAGRAVYTPQDESLVTYAPKMKKSDGFVDFAESARSLDNKVRGFWPWPGVHAEYVCHQTHKRLIVIIAEVEVVGDEPNDPKQVGLLDDDLNIICGSGRLRIVKIKPAGKGMMQFKDFVNGHRCKPADMFKTVETL
ncbi:MAG: methionyl-tRNA formyltransferase, partial [Anaerohalosphaera sp.]|nr:methionyl-tRNA formyltransferase [Anaerohalosphaera sp.]